MNQRNGMLIKKKKKTPIEYVNLVHNLVLVTHLKI